MIVVRERAFQTENGNIYYKVFRPRSFRLAPVRRDPRSLAFDYSSFLNWDGRLDESVIAVQNVDIADISSSVNFGVLTRTRGGDELFTSLRSLVSYWSRCFFDVDNQNEVTSSERVGFEGILMNLESMGLIASKRSASASAGATIVGDLGSVREAGILLPQRLISSAGYFVISPEECVSHHQIVGDTIGLLVVNSVVVSAATYRRPAIFIDSNGRATIKLVGIEDHLMRLPSGQTVDGANSDNTTLTIRSRANRQDQPTIKGSNIIDLIVIGNKVSGVKFGGGTTVPHAGFVISGPSSAYLVDPVKMLEKDRCIHIELKNADDVVEAVQCGPLLVSKNQIIDEATTLIKEELVPYSLNEIVVPAPFRKSVGQTKAARCGVGIDSDGRLVVAIIKGTSTGHQDSTGLPNTGATLNSLAQILYSEGAIDALALDSGGSVQLYLGAGALVGSGDTRGNAAANFDRALSNIMVYT